MAQRIEWVSPSANPGILHAISPSLSAFEPAKLLASFGAINTVLWVGGYHDIIGSVSYPKLLATALPPRWSLMTASLRSAGLSFGICTLADDAIDINIIVDYIKALRPDGQIVLMGHSYGSYRCMEYLTGPLPGGKSRPSVEGIIFQAPVANRENLPRMVPEILLNEANALALQWVQDGREKDVLPSRFTKPAFGRVAVTARRWLDMASPGPEHNGADEYFSTDLSDHRLRKTFGRIPPSTPVLLMFSGADQFALKNVDPNALLERWMGFVERAGGKVDRNNSGVVEGASHNLNASDGKVVQDLIYRVRRFTARLDAGDFRSPSAPKI